MLLTQLIDQQQQSYAQIQVQIEALQEQQRQIQAHLQRLGSVESQMVSAVQVMSEAIASINEVCPSELANYKDLVCGLFNKPLAALPGNDDDLDPDPTPDPSAKKLPEVQETIEAMPPATFSTNALPVSEHGNDDDLDPDPTPDPSVEKLPELSEEEQAIEAEVVAVLDHQSLVDGLALKVDLMTYAQIRHELASRRLNNKGNHAILKTRLLDHYKTLDVTELMTINPLQSNQQAA